MKYVKVNRNILSKLTVETKNPTVNKQCMIDKLDFILKSVQI